MDICLYFVPSVCNYVPPNHEPHLLNQPLRFILSFVVVDIFLFLFQDLFLSMSISCCCSGHYHCLRPTHLFLIVSVLRFTQALIQTINNFNPAHSFRHGRKRAAYKLVHSSPSPSTIRRSTRPAPVRLRPRKRSGDRCSHASSFAAARGDPTKNKSDSHSHHFAHVRADDVAYQHGRLCASGSS